MKCDSSNFDSRPWTVYRRHLSFENPLQITPRDYRVYELLQYLEDGPKHSANKGYLYNLLGPGFETDDDITGYDNRDVAGTALLIRCLTTTESRNLIFDNLYHWRLHSDFSSSRPEPYKPVANPSQQRSNRTSLVNDSSEMWSRASVDAGRKAQCS